MNFSGSFVCKTDCQLYSKSEAGTYCFPDAVKLVKERPDVFANELFENWAILSNFFDFGLASIKLETANPQEEFVIEAEHSLRTHMPLLQDIVNVCKSECHPFFIYC
jgi:hypothetical protein